MSKPVLNALPELIAQGLLSEDTAQKIKSYYQLKEQAQPQRINIVFGVIGAILVGLGIILMVAHNWDEMSRPVKVVLSFLPLLIGQFFCGYSLIKKQANTTWKESSAVFLFFAVGASISLISQLYNFSGSMSSFLFTWMLLCLPLIYIMPSSMASLLYIVGVTVYGVEVGYGYKETDHYHYWWLILLALPHYWQLIKKYPDSNFTFLFHWFFPISFTICLATLKTGNESYLFVAYMSLFGAYYLLGNSPLIPIKRIISNGYLIIGSLGTICLLLAMSFKWFWTEIDYNEKSNLPFPELIALVLPTGLALFLLVDYVRKRAIHPINWMCFIFALFIPIFFIGKSFPMMGVLMTNLLLLAAAIFTIQRGLLLNHLGILNYGLLIIAVLVVCRFFDSNLSFVLRGLMFVGVGAGFFFANSLLMKKRKQHEQ